MQENGKKMAVCLFIFSSFILIFKTMTCCWVLHFSDPYFINLLHNNITRLIQYVLLLSFSIKVYSLNCIKTSNCINT